MDIHLLFILLGVIISSWGWSWWHRCCWSHRFGPASIWSRSLSLLLLLCDRVFLLASRLRYRLVTRCNHTSTSLYKVCPDQVERWKIIRLLAVRVVVIGGRPTIVWRMVRAVVGVGYPLKQMLLLGLELMVNWGGVAVKSRVRSSRKMSALFFSFKTLQFLRFEVLPVMGI